MPLEYMNHQARQAAERGEMPKRWRDIEREQRNQRNKLKPSSMYSVEQRVSIWEDAGRMCYYCNRPLPRPGTKSGSRTQFDHKVPIKLGGKHDPSNLVCCCRRCNQEKGGSSNVEFLKRKRKAILTALERIDYLLGSP